MSFYNSARSVVRASLKLHLIAALFIALMPCQAMAAVHTVGDGGAYATLQDIFLSGVLQEKDEIFLLNDDDSLDMSAFQYGTVDIPRDITIRSVDESVPVFITRSTADPEIKMPILYPDNDDTHISLKGVVFRDNPNGNAIGEYGKLTLKDFSNVSFLNNNGAALYGMSIKIDNSSNLNFTGNKCAINGEFDGVTISNVQNMVVQNNSHAGIVGYGVSMTSLKNAEFKGNGTAVIASTDLNLTDSENIAFIENSGGALISEAGRYFGGTINVSGNKNVLFQDNSFVFGGALSATRVTLSNNNDMTFDGNKTTRKRDPSSFSTVYGGAVYAQSAVTFTGNGDYVFKNNQAIYDIEGGGSAYGGAIASVRIDLGASSSYHFENNSAAGGSVMSGYERSGLGLGGAIYASTTPDSRWDIGHLNVNNATFNNNKAYSLDEDNPHGGLGGAIYSSWNTSITNSSFAGNSASGYGGAIANVPQRLEGSFFGYNTITIGDNTSFSANTAGKAGGAIYTNGHIVFNGNSIISGNTAGGVSDGIYINTDNFDEHIAKEKRNLTIAGGAGTVVRFDDSVRAVGENGLDFNKRGAGSLIWGDSSYFSNGSALNLQAGNTTLSNNFTLQADALALNLGASHSLYLELTGRDQNLALFSSLGRVSASPDSIIQLVFSEDPGVDPLSGLGRWMVAESVTTGWSGIYQAKIYTLVNDTIYYGASFELDNGQLWVNLGHLASTPIPASAGLLGLGLLGLGRLRKRLGKAA